MVFIYIFLDNIIVSNRKEQQLNKIGDRDVELLQEGLEQRDENISDLMEKLETTYSQLG